jgi:hypothetical protein
MHQAAWLLHSSTLPEELLRPLCSFGKCRHANSVGTRRNAGEPVKCLPAPKLKRPTLYVGIWVQWKVVTPYSPPVPVSGTIV